MVGRPAISAVCGVDSSYRGMSAFLSIIGGLGLIIFAVWLLASLIKRKDRKKPLIGLGISIVLLIVAGIISPAPAPDGNGAVADPPEVEQPATEAPAEVPLVAEEIAYANKISEISFGLSKAFDEIGKATQNFELTDEWIFGISSHIAMIYAYTDEAYKIQAPPRFSEAHVMFLQAMDKYKESMDKLTYGIDNLDAVEIEKASALMVEGSELMTQVTKKFVEFQ